MSQERGPLKYIRVRKQMGLNREQMSNLFRTKWHFAEGFGVESTPGLANLTAYLDKWLPVVKAQRSDPNWKL